MAEKVCTTCGETKPLSEFRKADGPDYLCTICNRKKVAQWRTDNPGRNATACREWYYKNQRRVRDFSLRKNYGISIEEHDAMVQAQGNVCAICCRQSRDGVLRVDHNHVTGNVRGLLCDICNRAIGLMGDSPERLRAAADYIEHDSTDEDTNAKSHSSTSPRSLPRTSQSKR